MSPVSRTTTPVCQFTESTAPPPEPFDTAVTCPLALTVTLALVNDPTLLLTVGSVAELLHAGIDISPVIAAREATTSHVVGDMVRVPSLFVTVLIAPVPALIAA